MEKRHWITFNSPLNYNGRTEEIYFPKAGTCPSRIDIQSNFFIRLNPFRKIRTPCGSYQQLKINPDTFDPEDGETLIRSVKTLQSNQEFLEFLKTGTTEEDVCDFCIREYLNKRN